MGRNAFNEILQTRDIILVDQRGTGRSAPMTCPNMTELEEDPERIPTTEESIAAAIQCLDEFEHDPAFFTTSAAVHDLDRVRAAFGAEEINIYGISYGTRVAQHYVRRYPEHTRRVILDGLVPASATLGPDILLLSDAALRALFRRCDADDDCRSTFPDLERRFDEMLDELRLDPRRVTILHPRTAEPTPVLISPETLAIAVRLMLYNQTSMALLPSVVDAAWRGAYQPLATQMIAVGDSLGELAQGSTSPCSARKTHLTGDRSIVRSSRLPTWVPISWIRSTRSVANCRSGSSMKTSRSPCNRMFRLCS